MAVMKTHISWTDSTWNPTVGCTKVSAGCENCYAEAIVDRMFGGGFDTVKQYPNRLKQVHGFQPLPAKDGTGKRPRRVFVNSMSDLMHEQIDDDYRQQVFNLMEGQPNTIFQVLTKRPMTLSRFIEKRYADRGLPDNIWLGVSVENNKVKGRIDSLRRLKSVVGYFTAFLSVEPLIGPADEHDYSLIDWVLIGGESGQFCRPMKYDWLMHSINEARLRKAAIWFKQYGHPRNNPIVTGLMQTEKVGIMKAWSLALERKLEREADEKGGATLLSGEVLHEHPPAYEAIKQRINGAAKVAPGQHKLI